VKKAALLKKALGDVDLAYQNLESVELGVTTVDHYFDTLGGIARAVKRARGGEERQGLYLRHHAGRGQGAHA
jgi:magnesium chelatase subunit H